MACNTVFLRKTILEGLADVVKESFISLRGTGREYKIEPKPQMRQCDLQGEVVEEKISNVFMIWGRDRPGSCESGYGGRGPETHNSSFRIIVGSMGSKAKSVNSEGDRILGNPSIEQDAATLYMSQKTDIDDDWLLAPGHSPAKTRSAIGLKADGVRIVARESLRLYSGAQECGSQGQNIIPRAHGIELIASNDASDLQPLAKGDNLAAALRRLVHHIGKLAGIVDSIVMLQSIINIQIFSHSHICYLDRGLIIAPPDITPGGLFFTGMALNADYVFRSKLSLLGHRINLTMYTMNYLSSIGDGWICSMNNKTT